MFLMEEDFVLKNKFENGCVLILDVLFILLH